MLALDVSIFGLPLHPLIVHLVVIALPVGALATIAGVVSPWFRVRYAGLAVIVLCIGAVAACFARSSGMALAEIEGTPVRHATWGHTLMVTSLITAGIAALWWWSSVRQRATPPRRISLLPMALGALTVGLCLATTVLTGLTGHSGAEAVWGAQPVERDRPAAGAAATPSSSATPTPSVSGSTASGRTFTFAEVAQHNAAASCWIAVDRVVYDVTSWPGSHPGGTQRILNLCGTDATDAFRAQHADNPRPNNRLAGFRLGDLA